MVGSSNCLFGPSGLPALIYKFNRKPIKVRLLGESISDELIGSGY